MNVDPFVRAAQKRLATKGFYRGSIDGLAGPQTVAAIKAFEKSVGQPQDGTLDPKTWNLLDDAGERATEIKEIREGDDPTLRGPVEHTAMVWPRQNECDIFYGRPKLDGRGGGTAVNQTLLTLPYPMRLAWDLDDTINRITCHEKVHDSLLRIFENTANEYDHAARQHVGLDIFGGSTVVRKMRGGSSLSMHSYGIAIDLDPLRNQLKWGRDRARLAKPDAEAFWRIVEDEGWISLGRQRNFDWMHFQAARL